MNNFYKHMPQDFKSEIPSEQGTVFEKSIKKKELLLKITLILVTLEVFIIFFVPSLNTKAIAGFALWANLIIYTIGMYIL